MEYPDCLVDQTPSCKHLIINRMAAFNFSNLYRLYRTWCPTVLQHLCCKVLINKWKWSGVIDKWNEENTLTEQLITKQSCLPYLAIYYLQKAVIKRKSWRCVVKSLSYDIIIIVDCRLTHTVVVKRPLKGEGARTVRFIQLNSIYECHAYKRSWQHFLRDFFSDLEAGCNSTNIFHDFVFLL